MSLIRVSRHTREDIAAWRAHERNDATWAESATHAERVSEAFRALSAFVAAGRAYVSTSWGKDSVVVAHLAYQLCGARLPLVHVRVEHENPYCVLVRDEFLARFAADYSEELVTEESEHRPDPGFRAACRRLGTARYVSGVRGEESGQRRRRMQRWGHSSLRTCAPIGDWEARDVWAYLWAHDLPVHPAYAMTHGGRLDRDAIRVASVGGERGRGFGREEWERRYLNGGR